MSHRNKRLLPRRSRRFYQIGLMLVLPAFGVLAAEPHDALQAVVVTAKGYAADPLQTPIATLVLERAEWLDRGAVNLGQALRGQPGLAVASDGAQGQNPVIRGLKQESVVLLVDGIRLNSAQPVGAIASFMSLGLAERIEVVKGPSSVLHGSGALGGVINVLLPQAQFNLGTRLGLELGYNSADESLRSSGVLRISNADHALMLGVALAGIEDYRSPIGIVPRTGYDSASMIAQYRMRLDSANQLRLSLQQHKDEDVWYPGSARPHPHPQIGRTVVHSPTQERRLLELGWTRQGFGPSEFNLDLRLYRQEVQRRIYSRAFNQAGADIADIGRTQVNFVTDGLDARADWLAHPQHLLSFGLNAWRMQAAPERMLRNPPHLPSAPMMRNDPFSDGQINALGLYLQNDMRFGALNLLAGMRHDRVRGSASSVANPVPNMPRTTQGLVRQDDMWSASLAAIYEIAPLWRPYANWSRGVRAGEMRQRFEAAPRGDGFFYAGNPQIRPETATQLEFGLKGESDNLAYRLSVFRAHIDDFITGRDISNTLAASAACGPMAFACKETINLGQARMRGFEAMLRWQWRSEQWLSASYTQVQGDNRDLGEPLFQMPADEINLGWQGRIAAHWQADAVLRMVRAQNRVATIFTRGTENPTPGFNTIDLGATWHRGAHRVRLALLNLTDQTYHEHLSDGISGQEPKASGRSFFLGYQVQF